MTNKNEEDEIVKTIYLKFMSLVNKLGRSSLLLSNWGIGTSAQSKFVSLQIMQDYTIEKAKKLFSVCKEEQKHSIALVNTTSSLYECTAFFEAYLNAFYSFLQIIAKITPYFYDTKFAKGIPVSNFGKQRTYFKAHPEIDRVYANYLQNNMDWYDELICNRHAISHNVSAFLGFGEEEVEFIHMQKKRIDYFESGKPSKKIEDYVQTNWIALLDFLDFYVDHFSTRKIMVDNVNEYETVKKFLK